MIIVQTAQRIIGVWNSSIDQGSSANDPLEGVSLVVNFDRLEGCEQRVGWLKNSGGRDFIVGFSLPNGGYKILVEVKEPGVPITVDLLELATDRSHSSYVTTKGVTKFTDLNITYDGPHPREISHASALSSTLMQGSKLKTLKGDASKVVSFDANSVSVSLSDASTTAFLGLPIDGGSSISQIGCGTVAWPFGFVQGQKQDWLRAKYTLKHSAYFSIVDRSEALGVDLLTGLNEAVLGAHKLVIDQIRSKWVLAGSGTVASPDFLPTTRSINTTFFVAGTVHSATAVDIDVANSQVGGTSAIASSSSVSDRDLESFNFSRFNDSIRGGVVYDAVADESTHFIRVRTSGANVSVRIGYERS